MATFNIIVNNGSTNKETNEFSGTKEQAILEMLKRYAYWFDDQYFPNDDLTEVHDCDSEISWQRGDTYIGRGERHAFIEEVEADTN
jgi:hypothetical protein